MSLGDTTENELGLLIFNAVAMADIAENDTSSPATFFDVALHTADPGEGGDMSTSEAAYSGYGRETVARTSGGWTVAAENVSNAALVTFGTSSDGPETLTHFSIGKTGGGATQIIASGALNDDLIVNNLITPEFAIGALDIDWD